MAGVAFLIPGVAGFYDRPGDAPYRLVGQDKQEQAIKFLEELPTNTENKRIVLARQAVGSDHLPLLAEFEL